MIELVSKTKRKSKIHLTLKVKSPKLGLVFRPWMLVKKDGTSEQDPSGIVYKTIDSLDETEIKFAIDTELIDVSRLELGLVEEGVSWHEVVAIDL